MMVREYDFKFIWNLLGVFSPRGILTFVGFNQIMVYGFESHPLREEFPIRADFSEKSFPRLLYRNYVHLISSYLDSMMKAPSKHGLKCDTWLRRYEHGETGIQILY